MGGLEPRRRTFPASPICAARYCPRACRAVNIAIMSELDGDCLLKFLRDRLEADEALAQRVVARVLEPRQQTRRSAPRLSRSQRATPSPRHGERHLLIAQPPPQAQPA